MTPRVASSSVRVPAAGLIVRLTLVGATVLAMTVLGGCSRETAPPATTVDPMVQWCDVAAELTGLADSAESPGTTDTAGESGGSEKATLDQLVTLLDKAKSVAPPEISSDVAAAADSAHQISNLLASVNYDDSKINDEMLSRYQALGEELAQSSAVIANFNQRYCGVGTDDPRRDQTIADLVLAGLTQDEASCLYDAMAATASDEGTSGVSSGQELFASCGIDPARADAIAAALASELSE